MGEFGFRPATPEETQYSGEPLNLIEDFTEVLQRGHVIDAFSSGGGIRVVRIFEDQECRDGSPLLGYGEDANVEDALRRARDTYRHREAQGQAHMNLEETPEQWPEVGIGLLTGGRNISPLDNIAWGQGFKAYQDGDEVVVWTQWGKHTDEPWEGRGPTLQAAADRLSVRWTYSLL
jgi:hypothetical protein